MQAALTTQVTGGLRSAFMVSGGAGMRSVQLSSSTARPATCEAHSTKAATAWVLAADGEGVCRIDMHETDTRRTKSKRR